MRLGPNLPSYNINKLRFPYRVASARGQQPRHPTKRVPTGKDAIAECAEHVGTAYLDDIRCASEK